ncbi:MAG: hypothetical protein WC907_04125 [Acholeplasmataceae bacterium]|jgi:hypothetical protein
MTVKMMKRVERGCGFRVKGGVYLMGGDFWSPCQRLPMAIPVCPTCGNTIEFFRGIKQFNPKELFGDCRNERHTCHSHTCPVCFPPEKAWVMWVGSEYTPRSFVEEAKLMGVSKRIPYIPNAMQTGDWVWLCYKKVFKRDHEKGHDPGVFFAFQVTEVQKILTDKQQEDEEYIAELERFGITPVIEVE